MPGLTGISRSTGRRRKRQVFRAGHIGSLTAASIQSFKPSYGSRCSMETLGSCRYLLTSRNDMAENMGTNDPLVPRPWSTTDHGGWTFWQFTDHGDGYKYGVESKEIDLNYFNE